MHNIDVYLDVSHTCVVYMSGCPRCATRTTESIKREREINKAIFAIVGISYFSFNVLNRES